MLELTYDVVGETRDYPLLRVVILQWGNMGLHVASGVIPLLVS